MTTRKLERQTWHTLFDRISKTLQGKQAEVEVVGLALGDQVEAEWLPLYGIVYEPKSDVAEVVLEGLDHLIHKPREIYIEEEEPGVLTALEIVAADGTRHIVKLRDPLMLPAPQT